MIVWIMVIYVTTGNQSPLVIDQEFKTRNACIAKAKKVKDLLPTADLMFTCAEKVK